jgi:microcystin-dependent protein
MDFPTAPIDGQTSPDGRYYFDSSVGDSGAWRSAPLPVGGLPAGSIIQWSSNTAPANWLVCDGAAVSRATFSSLFAVIGTTYGVGNGSTTFNLPDLRGRVAVGRDGSQTEFDVLGETGGAKTHTLTINEMPSHEHGIRGGWGAGSLGAGEFRADSNNPATRWANTVATGGGGAHNNLQPYLVTNYIIKASSGWTAGDSELATRLGAVEARPLSGLVPIVPASVQFVGGSGSISPSGTINFTSCTKIQVGNIFSGAFRNYKILVNGGAGGSNSSMLVRYMTGTSTEALVDNSYITQGIAQAGVGVPSAYQTTNSYFFAGDIHAQFRSDYTIFSPFESVATQHTIQHMGFTSTPAHRYMTGGGRHDTIASYTGISFIISVGSSTGNIQIFGFSY